MTEVATGRRFERWSWFSLENQEGITRCLHCEDWERNGNFAETGEQFEEHLRKDHPDIKPRSRKQILQELERKKREAKRAREKEANLTAPKSRKRHSSRSGPHGRQPNLTDPMIEKMKKLYGEAGSVVEVARRCYEEFGFSSPERLRDALQKARREQGIVIGIPKNRRRITDETVEKILRLFKEEGLSVPEIAECLYQHCGYSCNGLRNAIYDLLRKSGFDPRVNATRVGGNKPKMTSAHIEVAWQLHSVGNYTLEEISELSKEFWDVHKNTISGGLRRAGYKSRLSKRGKNTARPISQEEALKLIKSVSEF